MEFEQFVTAIGYLTLLQIAVVVVFILIIMFLGREKFTVARYSVEQGLPGPVWWYHPMRTFSQRIY